MNNLSVTEEEIYNGLLKAEKPSRECHWFRRHIVDLSQHTDERTCGRYMDLANKQMDKEAQDLLGKLRSGIRCVNPLVLGELDWTSLETFSKCPQRKRRRCILGYNMRKQELRLRFTQWRVELWNCALQRT